MALTKYLVIAEEPTLGRAIAAAVPEHSDGSKAPAGEYRVVAARGHLLQLKPPEVYDEKYKKWNIEDLPIAFPNWATIPKEGRDAGDTADIRRRLAKIKEGLDWCDCVIHAGDPDDEGQLLIDEILEFYHNKKPVKRILINDMSESYVLKQINKMEDNAKYYPLGRGAWARGIADAMFGYNYTRYFSVTQSTKGPLSVGRVQTPTLGLVVNRDRQIEGFTKTLYYIGSMTAKEHASSSEVRVTLAPDKDSDLLIDGKILSEDAFKDIFDKTNGKSFAGTVSRAIKYEDPKLPFNLAALQAACNISFGMSPSETLDTTQSLRMKNLITYNRSSCRYLHESQHAEAPGVMKAVFVNLGVSYPVDYSMKSACFDEKPLEGQPHHAIIPTETTFPFSKLNDAEKKVYQIICTYYIIQFLPKKKLQKSDLKIDLPDGWTASASSSVVIDPGFGSLLGVKATEKADYSSLDNIAEGSGKTFTLSDPSTEGKETKPPKRYTQATLIMDMTSIAKYVTDPRVKKLLIEKDSEKKNEHGSIGTPATRSGIVDKLLQRGYIEEVKEGKKSYLRSTPLGRSFYDLLPENIKGVDITTDWWLITRDIQEEKEPVNALYDAVLANIEEFLANPPKFGKVDGVATALEVLGKCPRCGRDIVVGKKGYGCTGWKDKENPCNFTIWKSSPLLESSGKEITKTMAKSLLKDGFCIVKGLKSKTGKKYDGKFVLDDTGTYVNLKLDFGDSDAEDLSEKEAIGTCPRCGKKVVETDKAFMCESYKDSEAPCKFVIWKDNALLAKSRKTITKEMAISLLETGKCTLTGLKSKSGSKYDAEFILHDDGEKVNLELHFPESSDEVDTTPVNDEPLGKCPRCGKVVLEYSKVFACEGITDTESSCKFAIRKDNALLAKNKKTLTRTMVKDLLAKGKCDLKGLTSSSGKKYDAFFTLKDDGSKVQLEMSFPERPKKK